MEKKYVDIIHELAPETIEFNPSSGQQLQQLLFAPFKRKKDSQDKKDKNSKLIFQPKSVPGDKIWEEPENNNLQETPELQDFANNPESEETDVMKIVRKMKVVDEFPETRYFKVSKLPNYDYSQVPMSDFEKRSKFREMPIKGLGIPATKLSATGLPSVDIDSLKHLLNGTIDAYFK